ncbi:MAG: hypothetical protein MEQ07_02885 [Aquimonas sp.]|nr:hypothetical protein [Aquimonas sp.]
MNSPAVDAPLSRPALRSRRHRLQAPALDPRPWLLPESERDNTSGPTPAADRAGRARGACQAAAAPGGPRLALVLLALLVFLPGLALRQSTADVESVRTSLAFDPSLPMLASALKLDERKFLQRHAVPDASQMVSRGEAEIALSQPSAGLVRLTAPRRAEAAVREIESTIQRQLPGMRVAVEWTETSAQLSARLPFLILGGLIALCLLPGSGLGQALGRSELAVRLATRGLGGLALTLALLLTAVARDGGGLGVTAWALTSLACLLLSFGLAAVGQGLDRAIPSVGLRWALWALALALALAAAAAARLGWEPSASMLSPATAAIDLLRGLLGGAGFSHPPALTVALIVTLLAASPLLHPSARVRTRPPRPLP